MATIEPRLIHLLNDSPLSDTLPTDLPPLQSLNFPPQFSSRPLPLEPDATQTVDKPSIAGLPSANTIAALLPPAEDGPGKAVGLRAADSKGKGRPTLSNKNSHSILHLLEQDEDEPSSSRRKHSDDHLDDTEEGRARKRRHGMTAKEDFVQLPQPLKKQKAATQVVPPIINGLLSPPPNAALLPPISSEPIDDPDLVNMALLKDFSNFWKERADFTTALVDQQKAKVPKGAKPKRKALKPYRKWTSEETHLLLRGVARHGVGKWSDILEDPDFKFENRSAIDLKDRFRTCCPDEFRPGEVNDMKKGGKARKTKPENKENRAPRTAREQPSIETLISEPEPSESLLEPTPEEPPQYDRPAEVQPEDATVSQASCNEDVPQAAASNGGNTGSNVVGVTNLHPPSKRLPRAHRKRLGDLSDLGIREPFKRSSRRERRPFTEQDDRDILRGFELYGPHWTKILRDPRFNSLANRQPTDLRDRLRNMRPELFAKVNGPGTETVGSKLLEPSVHMVIESLEPFLGLTKPTSLLESSGLTGASPAAGVSQGSALGAKTRVVARSGVGMVGPRPMHHAGSREELAPSNGLALGGFGKGPLAGAGVNNDWAEGGDDTEVEAIAVMGEMDISRFLLD